MNIQTTYIVNGAAVLLLLILLLSARKTVRYSLLDGKIFYVMVTLTIMQSIVEAGTFYIDGKLLTGYHQLSLAANCVLYINNIVFAFLWTIYADFKLFSDVERIKRRYPFVAIPAMLITAGSVVNLFTPVFFRVTEQNVYQRTGLYWIPCACTYFYLAYGVGIIYKNKGKVNKYLFMPAVLFMIPILLTSVVQFLNYGLSLTWLGVAIALTALYINVQNEVSYIDSLSGLFTRQYMKQYLESETKRSIAGKQLAGIMLDIDQFKSINDKFGHLMGDDAIQSVGKILHRSVPERALAVRYAGDEFMIILYVGDADEVTALIQHIDEMTEAFNLYKEKPYLIHFSKGFSIYGQADDSVDAFLGRMDDAMYAEKRTKEKISALR